MTKGKNKSFKRRALRCQLKKSSIGGRVSTTKLIRYKYGAGAKAKEIG
jgi:hypothetical protein